MHAGVFTLFATHFSALRQLEVLYPNVKLCQFAVNAGEGSFQCTWQLKAGAVDVPHYGLMLASDAGFPEQVTQGPLPSSKHEKHDCSLLLVCCIVCQAVCCALHSCRRACLV